MELKKLKSGSDFRGTAYGQNAELTADVVSLFAAGFAQWRSDAGSPLKTVAIGRDSRVTGEALLNAAADGLRAMGVHVMDFGLCTTPAMFMCLITEGFQPDAALMITASHQPMEKNGIKFILPHGGVSGKELDEIIARAGSVERNPVLTGTLVKRDFLPAYKAFLQGRIREALGAEEARPLTGLHVIVDAGNGAGGFYAGMLEELGARVEGSQFLTPDGTFPNHIPNPEDPAAMASISAAVKRYGADLGVIFDTDCDRAAIVDQAGREINRNRLIALISAILLKRAPGGTIVTDSVTSSGLARFITEQGGVHYRFKRGYRNVIDEAIRLNEAGVDCPLAIETSGHAALRENHFLDDGMYLATILIAEAMRLKQEGKALSSLISDLQEPKESVELRLPLSSDDNVLLARRIIDRVTDYASSSPNWHIAPDNREGIRIHSDLDGGSENGWFLLRLSVHDPVMPLNIESDVEGGVLQMARGLYQALKDEPHVDLSALRHFIDTASR